MSDRTEGQLVRSTDFLGIVVSSLCLMHCLALPVALALIPAISSQFAEQEWVHLVLVVCATGIIGWAFPKGLRVHHQFKPLGLALIGLTLLSLALLVGEGHWAEKVLTSIGALATAAAHLWNHSLARRRLGGQ